MRALPLVAAATLLTFSGAAEASRLPDRPEVKRGRAIATRHRVVRVEWKKELTERELLGYEPREIAGPSVAADNGDVFVGSRNGLVRLFDARDRELWNRQLKAAPVGSAAISEEAVFIGTTDGFFYGIDRFNGEFLFTQNLGGQVLARAAVTDSAVFVGTDHDAVHALDPATGDPLWVYRRSTPTALGVHGGTAITLSNGRVYAGFSDGAVVALGAEDGRVIWQTQGAGRSLEKFPNSLAAPVVQNGVVYATVFNDGVYAYDAANGKIRWRADAQGAASLTPSGGLLLVGGAGKARAFQADSGAPAWTIDLGKSFVTRPVVINGVVLMSGPEGILIAATETGKPLGRFHPGSGFSTPPGTIGSTIYALSDLGFFYRLELVAEKR
ncbi:PQQ-binding-like beta-propeller repeat protein [Vulgatibacter incomptus]|uniref:Putative cell surface protein/ lipoprotein n=1 Tax=Vulgatibacter incomptus TaxID=1391653 RepID=A0A0K1PBS6_9BACT|nr:PQQ-binding-like beta-propeller repeat protein [Vulgatibacter incomptus]AKU90952.1 putative cell surface protein/ lipoprotein [Vulgatibacter incomptus]